MRDRLKNESVNITRGFQMKKWWKTLSMAAASLVLASALTGCGVVSSGGEDKSSQAKEDGDKIVVGFSMDTLKEERWQRDKDLFEAKVKELEQK